MKHKRIFGVLLSLALLISATIPGTLAISTDITATDTEYFAEDSGSEEENNESELQNGTIDNDGMVSGTTQELEMNNSSENEVDKEESGNETDKVDEKKNESTEKKICTCEGTEEEKQCSDFVHSEGCDYYVDAVDEKTTIFDKMMATTTTEEFLAIEEGMSEAEKKELTENLSEEQLKALQNHLQEISDAENHIDPKTVVFTKAGPFMPPVNVAKIWRMMRSASNGTTEDNGLELSKEAKANEDGTYTIRMEAYTTGEVTTTTKTSPVDVVLVLDQSGSMAYGFNGNTTNDNSARRQYAMKQAVNNFISEVAKKHSAEADHRMAIVTFGSSASTLQGWTTVDSTGESALKTRISSLPDSPSGATNVAAGMQQAETLMGSGYSYTGTNTQRQKVVIVFTDGVPTTSTDFDTTVATNAIKSAKNLKDTGTTVYTVGIFNGANPAELFGEKWDYKVYDDIPCTGEVGSYWGGSWLSELVGSNDFDGIDVAAGNRFLNYLASNFLGTTEIGLERGSFNPSSKLGGNGTGYKITKNFSRSDSGYYLTANDSESLNRIFETISDNIQTANIDLGSQTVVKDTVSQYFELPENVSEIKLYTAEYTGTYFSEEQPVSDGVTTTITDGAVIVTGFDYNENFVSDTVKEDGTYGKKLIIEFTVSPKSDFIGGNDVPTNDWENTAVYDKDGNEVEKFADNETTPTVNVPIKQPEFTVNDKTIYEGNSTEVNSLYTLPDITGDNAWKYDFVNVNGSVSDIVGETISPDDCTEYTVSVVYTPKTDGNDSVGQANAMTGVSNSNTVWVHVLKPVVTASVNDVQKYYGETYILGDGTNGDIRVDWEDKNSHTSIPAVEGTVPYGKENLHLSFVLDGYTGTVPKNDFDVTVKVMKGDTEIENAIVTTECSYGCDSTQSDGTYTVHVETCTLKVIKTGGKDGEPYVFTIYKGQQSYTQVTITGNGEATICELPIGEYSIREDEGWSWRYSAEIGNSVTLGSDNTRKFGSINCDNNQEKESWLNGYSDVVTNIAGQAPINN